MVSLTSLHWIWFINKVMNTISFCHLTLKKLCFHRFKMQNTFINVKSSDKQRYCSVTSGWDVRHVSHIFQRRRSLSSAFPTISFRQLSFPHKNLSPDEISNASIDIIYKPKDFIAVHFLPVMDIYCIIFSGTALFLFALIASALTNTRRRAFFSSSFAFLFPARLSEAIRHTLLDLNSISARSVNKNQPDIWK